MVRTREWMGEEQALLPAAMRHDARSRRATSRDLDDAAPSAIFLIVAVSAYCRLHVRMDGGGGNGWCVLEWWCWCMDAGWCCCCWWCCELAMRSATLVILHPFRRHSHAAARPAAPSVRIRCDCCCCWSLRLRIRRITMHSHRCVHSHRATLAVPMRSGPLPPPSIARRSGRWFLGNRSDRRRPQEEQQPHCPELAECVRAPAGEALSLPGPPH